MVMSDTMFKQAVVKNLEILNKSLEEIAKVGNEKGYLYESEVKEKLGMIPVPLTRYIENNTPDENFVKGALMVINFLENAGDNGLYISNDNMLEIESKLQKKGWNGHYGYTE